jgi:YidC/Oxa1 family membrane protein insertase
MDKRTLIALILIGIVFLAWPLYMRKVVGVKEPEPEMVSEYPEMEESIQESPAVDEPDSRFEEYVTEERSSKPEMSQKKEWTNAETVILENNLFIGKLSSVGGGTITSWKLKEYKKPRKFIEKDPEIRESDTWVELIPSSSQGNLSLETRYADLDLSNVVFKVQHDTLGEVKTVRFEHEVDRYGRVIKEFVVKPNSYLVDLNVYFEEIPRERVGESYSLLWQSGMMPTENQIRDDLYYYQGIALQGDELLKTKDKSTGLREGTTKWAAIRTKYFLTAMISKEPIAEAAKLEGESIENFFYAGETHTNWKRLSAQIEMPFRENQNPVGQFGIYLGPMDYNELRRMKIDLEKTMSFGWSFIKPFSIAFFYALEFLHDNLVHNYGWAIIIFAILIKIVLYPLTRKSFQSMKAMQALQPKIAELKEKYKDEPQKMNQETMKLYKKEGVNPMGGCLPMLLQMPVLFALFNLFRTTIMLRQANFLMIPDLSAPDGIIAGINLLPIVMGITMIIQQRLSNQNPQQKAMAFMMPIFLTFVFYRLSAGLNLYYMMFNLLTIGQELLIKRKT